MRFFCLFIICFTLSPPRFTLFPYTTLFRSQVFKQPQIKAKNDGVVRYHDLRAVRRAEGNYVVLNKNGQIAIYNDEGRELERYSVVVGAEITVADGGRAKKGEIFVQWDPYNV